MTASTHLPPGPRGNWLLGSIGAFRRDILGFLTHCAREHGPVSAFRLGPRRLVLVNDPALAHQVLVADNQRYVKPYNYQILRAFLGNGLLLNEGQDWLKQRRLIQPHFLRQRLLGYVEAAVRLTERYIAGWRSGEQRDLHTDFMRLTLQVISQAVLGASTEADQEVVDHSLEVLLEDYKYRWETGLDLPRWLPTPWNFRVRRAVGALDGVIGRMIAQRRANPEGPDDLLGRLLGARDDQGSGMTEQQLRDELITLLLAGHETTANTLSWTLYLLARHPEVEGQVVEEVRAVRGDGPLEARHLDRLKQAEQVLLESMRLYPTAYAVGRRPLEDVEVGGYRVAKGTTVMLSQWVMHRDPRWFDRADEFLPGRWAEGPRGLPERAYFPFGAGPRVCIGNHFAMVEALAILGTLLPRFRFRLAQDGPVVPWPSVTLRPRDGLPVVVEPREAVDAGAA